MARPKKKSLSEELLYYDGDIAIYDFDLKRGDEALKLLLEVEIDNPDTKKHIEPLIPFCGGLASSWTVDTHDVHYADKADIKSLNALGFKVDEGIISPIDFGKLKELRHITTLPKAQENVMRTAEYVQYLSKLYLLMKGDRRQAALIPDISTLCGFTDAHFELTLPWGFRYALASTNLDTDAAFDASKAQTIEEGRNFSIPVSVSFIRIAMYTQFTGIKTGSPWPNDEFKRKRLIASALLPSLLNYMSIKPFLVDESFALVRRSDDSWAGLLADCMIQEKIIACPWCGRPVLTPNKSSKPFCRQSHQTRYNEAAHARLDSGASVDEVAEAFPHINRKTIENWA